MVELQENEIEKLRAATYGLTAIGSGWGIHRGQEGRGDDLSPASILKKEKGGRWAGKISALVHDGKGFSEKRK